MYVTQQGVAKWYPTSTILNATAGKNGCPSQKDAVNVNIAWSASYQVSGATIPTNPPLVTGTPMTSGQSCGNEGVNVFVNKLISNPNVTYTGCYADNPTSPLMTFVGGSPPPPAVNLINGNFSQPQIPNNSYIFVNDSTTVPGWKVSALIFNNWNGWGYPTPFPQGSQCVALYTDTNIGQFINLFTGTYNLSFYACSGTNYGANTINILCNDIDVLSFTPDVNVGWKQYTTSFNIQQSGNYQLIFKTGAQSEFWANTGIQNIQLTQGSNSSSTPSYTYNQCKEAAIDSGVQYFALQGVNPSTSKGYCGISDNQLAITSLGPGMTVGGQQALWASNTASSETQNPGSTASLTNVGSLVVYNSSGQPVFSSPNSNAQPSNYLGCYGDNPNRAMPLFTGGSQQYDLQQCQALAQQNGSTYFGLQNSTSGTTAQCAYSNDFAQSTEYGTAGNCTQISDGSWSGGGWSNAIYNTSLPQSNYFLVLQDDGNMVVYRGTGPQDNQGVIWATGTNGQQQQANPVYAAANGKYGQNWISQGSTLAAGDFVGSTSGNMALIMQSDGNLVLYTFTLVSNCQKMSDGNTGGGVGANAIYNIGETGFQANMGQVAYIDQNSELHPYPSTNVQYGDLYSEMPGNNSWYNDIPNAAYGNATAESCQNTCNDNPECAGFVFETDNNVCWPKNSGMYPNGAKQLAPGFNLYIRNKTPTSTPIGVPMTTNNTNSITYQNYVNGGQIGNEYGLANATSAQKAQLSQLQSQLNLLSSQLSSYTGDFGTGSQQAETQSKTNVAGIQKYLKGLESTNNKIQSIGENGNIDNILNDSDIVVLQKNYDYLFWSILAAGTVLVSINIVKK